MRKSFWNDKQGSGIPAHIRGSNMEDIRKKYYRIKKDRNGYIQEVNGCRVMDLDAKHRAVILGMEKMRHKILETEDLESADEMRRVSSVNVMNRMREIMKRRERIEKAMDLDIAATILQYANPEEDMRIAKRINKCYEVQTEM